MIGLLRMNQDRFDLEQLREFSIILDGLMTLPLSYDRNMTIGKVIRKELDKAYRRGFTDGVRESKNEKE
jgi:hypothetical protein